MKSVLVIGLGEFGRLLARDLMELGHEVMAVDRNEARVNEILPSVTGAWIGDSTNEAFLRSLGVRNFDVCMVAISEDFQSSLETTALLKELGAACVVSRADRDSQEKFLLRIGADEVINPQKHMANWAATRYTCAHILDYVKLDDTHGIFEVDVPADWVGKTILEIDIRRKFSINILAVKDKGKMNLSILPDTRLKAGTTMLVLGERKALQKCFKM